MPKLPVVSGIGFASMLQKLGYQFVRQHGSHMIFRGPYGSVAVPKHREIDHGLLRSMLKTVSTQTGFTLEELREMLF